MTSSLAIFLGTCLFSIACGGAEADPAPTQAPMMLAGASVGGNVIGAGVPIAKATAPTGWAAPLAASSGADDFTILKQPDVPRTAQVSFGAGWPGAIVVQICGTDSAGNICDTIYPAGPTINGSVPFWTITSVRKFGPTSASAATASVGPGFGLGLATQRQKADAFSFDVAQLYATKATVIEPAQVLQGAGDPAVVPTTAPDGAHLYEIYATLRP